MLKIVLVDWDGYPLRREKALGASVRFECGLLPLLESFEEFDAGVPIDIQLVIAGDAPARDHAAKYEPLVEQFSSVSGLTFRENIGLDLGSYNTGLDVIGASGYAGDLVLMNTSCRPPKRRDWSLDYRTLFHAGGARVGLCGISMTTILYRYIPRAFPFLSHSPHVQSFFLYSNTSVLEACFPTGLPVPDSPRKRDIIRLGEVEISNTVLRNGYSITSRLDPQLYAKGETWTGKLRPGFRFMPEFAEIVNRI